MSVKLPGAPVIDVSRSADVPVDDADIATANNIRRASSQGASERTYGYDSVTLAIGGNEVIRARDLIAMDANGQAVVAARPGLPVRNASGVVIGVAYDLPSATVAITTRDDLESLFGRGSELLTAYDAAARERAERLLTREGNRVLRDKHASRLCAAIDAAARKTPITVAELQARLYARPLPLRALADGRTAPRAYAQPDPLPLP